MSSIFGSPAAASSPVVPEASLRVQTSLEGVPQPLVWGMTRLAGNLIWYGGFSAVAVQQAQQGGKGGLFSTPSQGATTYEYFVSAEIALTGNQIAGIGQVWQDKSITTLSAVNLAIFGGSSGQLPWSYLTAVFPGQDFAYRNIAYVAGNLSLGNSAELPNWNFEVQGLLSYSVASQPDLDFTVFLADILTNASYGIPGWSSAYNGDWTQARAYTMAAGLLISYALTSATGAGSLLDEMITSVNLISTWSDGVLKLTPRGDEQISGNGFAYFPPTQPEYDLDDDDFLPNQTSFGNTSGDPISGQRLPPRQQNNVIKVEYLDRANSYNPAVALAQDDGAVLLYGERGSDSSNQWHWFQNAAAAGQAADLALGREKIANKYAFTTRPRYILLDVGDIITVTDAMLGLDRQWVRVLDVQENSDRSLNFMVEEYLAGTGAAPAYGREVADRPAPNYSVDPGQINAPFIFEPTDQLGQGLAVWVGVSGVDPDVYGGCDVWASYDGANYTRVPGGRVYGSSRMGVLSVALPTIAINQIGQTVDTVNTLSVDLTQSDGELASGSQTDALNFNTACWVGGEVIAFANASLAAVNKYNLTYLVRGGFGTEDQIGSHAIGTEFIRLDSGVLKIPFDQSRIGATVYLKFVPFNVYGVTVSSLADVEAYTYAITGFALTSPLPDVQSVRTVFEDGFQKIWWDQVIDFRNGIRYLVKKGASFAAAQVIADVAHPGLPAFGDGLYWIVAYCQPVAGLTVYSEVPTSITIAGSLITANVIEAVDFQAGGWTGTFNLVGKEGADPTALLRLDSIGNILTESNVLADPDVLNRAGIAPSGTWTSDNIIDIGYVAQCSVALSWLSAGTPIGTNILTLADFLNSPDILNAGSLAFVRVWPQIRVANTATLGVPDWGIWQDFVPGIYNCRYIEFQVQFSTQSPLIIAYLLSMTALLTIPGRIDHYLLGSVPSTGTTITFEPDNAAVASPFNGGPLVGGTNNHPLPAVNIAWQGSPGVNYIIDSLTLSQMTFHFVDGTATPVTVTGPVTVIVEGY